MLIKKICILTFVFLMGYAFLSLVDGNNQQDLLMLLFLMGEMVLIEFIFRKNEGRILDYLRGLLLISFLCVTRIMDSPKFVGATFLTLFLYTCFVEYIRMQKK